MIRQLGKMAACGALAWARLGAWVERGAPIVLGYHRIVDDVDAEPVMPGLVTSVAMLSQQLDSIGQRCRFVDLDELGTILASGRTPGRPVAAVTFDDGYADVRDHALPILAAKGIPGAVFVVSGAADDGRALLHDRLYRALVWYLRMSGQVRRPAYAVTRELIAAIGDDELGGILEAIEAEAAEAHHPLGSGGRESLTWDDLRALAGAGVIIGSHTVGHVALTRQAPAELAADLVDSRRQLEERLGKPIVHLAYPDGQFDATTVRAAADAGYQFAYTTCRHRDPAHPLLTVPRAMLWERSSLGPRGGFSPSVLACQTHGGLGFLNRCLRVH